MGNLQIPVQHAPFDAIAATYDETFTASCIGRAQRGVVTRELDRVFRPGQQVLELNCGTGIDALHLAARGIHVLACDSSTQMVEIAMSKRHAKRLDTPPCFRVLATEDITLLEKEGTTRFDGAFSNFAGLNCLADIAPVAAGLGRLLRPGAKCVLCLFGRTCLWEMVWYLGRARPAKAFRRLMAAPQLAPLGTNGVVEVHYHSVRQTVREFASNFRLVRCEGVGVTVPPSYVEPVARRFTRMLNLAMRADRYLGRCSGIRALADHVLLTFERI